MIFFWIYLPVMPKYWGKQIFSLGSFPEVGHKQKTEREKKGEKRRAILQGLRVPTWNSSKTFREQEF